MTDPGSLRMWHFCANSRFQCDKSSVAKAQTCIIKVMTEMLSAWFLQQYGARVNGIGRFFYCDCCDKTAVILTCNIMSIPTAVKKVLTTYFE